MMSNHGRDELFEPMSKPANLNWTDTRSTMTDIEQILNRHRRKQRIIDCIVIACIILAVVCMICIARKAHAADTNEYEIQFEWEYDKTIAGLKGYRLFQEGKLLVEVPDKNTLTVIHKAILAERTCFTMTAYGIDPEDESVQSAPYCIKRPLPMPVMVRPKYYRRYIDAGPVVAPVK